MHPNGAHWAKECRSVEQFLSVGASRDVLAPSLWGAGTALVPPRSSGHNKGVCGAQHYRDTHSMSGGAHGDDAQVIHQRLRVKITAPAHM